MEEKHTLREITSFTAPEAAHGDGFGWSVATDGRRVAVGAFAAAYGGSPRLDLSSVYLYRAQGEKEYRLEGRIDSADDRSASTRMIVLGGQIVLAGDQVVLGSDSLVQSVDATFGCAYVYRRVDDAWLFRGKLLQPGRKGEQRFGWSVAQAGERVLVGAPALPEKGFAFLFDLESKGLVAAFGLDDDTNPRGAALGSAVALQDEWAFAGAPLANSGEVKSAGTVTVYRSGESRWETAQVLSPPEPVPMLQFGRRVAVSGDRLLVGAPGFPFAEGNDPTPPGRAYVYARSASDSWELEATIQPETGGTGGGFALDLALDGDVAAIRGFTTHDVHVYRRGSDGWTCVAVLDDLGLPVTSGNVLDFHPTLVALGGGRLVVGVPGTIGAENGPGRVHVFAVD